MSTGLTIIGWFAQPVIENLLKTLGLYINQSIQQRKDLARDFEQLKSSLEKVSYVLRQAKRKWTADKHDDDLARLVTELRATVYDAEDLVGELDYETLSQKIEGGKSVYLPTFSPSLPANIIECKVREVGERLDQTAKKMEDLLKSQDGQKLPIKSKSETSFLTEPQVFGREDEKESIVEYLLSGSGGASFSIICIIGTVGVGKTTLARYVYNDPRVVNRFELKMWVCVSHSFDVERLTKQMIESATKKEQPDLSLDCLQMILQNKVKERKFLLVLDYDVMWEDDKEDDSEKWQMLCDPLRHGCPGSMILVTARSQRVAGKIDTMKLMHLKGLSNDDCWKIVKSRAFGPKVPSDLEAVRTSMTVKSNGLPSIAKSLADWLRPLNQNTNWRRIMDKEMWELDEIMKPLTSSYQHFPEHLKQCFSFCSIFPKEYPFNKHELVNVWAVQDFIAPRKNERIEDAGNKYLQSLKDQFFFESTEWDDQRYVIPNLMHELAHLASKEECFMLQSKCYHTMPSTVRHLSVCAENMEPNKLNSLGRNTKLRSLLIFENTMPNLNVAIKHWFDRLKYIRLLNLRHCMIDELPASIGNLKHLRYLDISWTRIKKLPDSLCLLYNLQVLNILGCSLESFPEGFTKLINLRYLDVKVNLISKIAKIGKLICLQELQQFQVLKKDGHRISELKKLSQLQKRLHIKNLEYVESKDDACQAKLDDKKYVDELFLEWSPGRSNFASSDSEVLEGLRPHHSLKQLEIRHYGGESSPSWLHRNLLSYISKLHIENCPNLKEIPCLTVVLEELRLVDLGLVTLPRLWDEGSSGVGESSQGSNSFKSSSLSKLHVERLPRLTSLEQWLLPLHLPKIKSIEIIDCEELMLAPTESFDHLENLNISDCPKLTPRNL